MKLFPACTCTKHLHFCSQLAVDCSVECRCRKFPPTITYLLTKHTGIPWKSQEREQSRQIHNWTTCALLPKWRQAVMLISCYSCDEIPAELHQAGWCVCAVGITHLFRESLACLLCFGQGCLNYAFCPSLPVKMIHIWIWHDKIWYLIWYDMILYIH